jgi:hypothetical protein
LIETATYSNPIRYGAYVQCQAFCYKEIVEQFKILLQESGFSLNESATRNDVIYLKPSSGIQHQETIVFEP